MTDRVKPTSMVRPVRVSYFDPRTGEPCATKPKPLRRGAAPDREIARKDKEAKRIMDEREGQEIAENMRKRRSKERKSRADGGKGRPGRRTMVDGAVYPSVREAAESIGAAMSTVAEKCRNGGGKVKGHDVRYVD